jgi:HSP20 family protein
MTSTRPRRRAALRRQGDPIGEIEDLYHRIGWLMQDVCGGRSAATDPMPAGAASADVQEADDSYLVDMNCPTSPRRISTRSYATTNCGSTVRSRTGSTPVYPGAGPAGRRFRVSAGAARAEVDPNRVEANLSDGVLTEPPRKSSADKPRRIEITI